MRALRKWADSFLHAFPSEAELLQIRKQGAAYFNWKIPTDWALLEGRHSSLAIRQEVASLLLQTCAHLIRNKPGWARAYRVTCVICLPQMFSSEICIYLDEAYFQSKINVAKVDVQLTRIGNASLAQQWHLPLPEYMQEIGMHVCYPDDELQHLHQHWYFGELD